MGKLQTGRFERLAARTYSIKGPGAMVDLDEPVLGVLQLARQGGLESHFIQAWETFGVRQNFGASVGNYNWFCLANPVGSGTIAVIDWYQRSNATPLKVHMTRGIPPGFAATSASDPLDSRIPNARQSACLFMGFVTNIGSFGQEVSNSSSAEQQHYTTVLGEDGTIAWRGSVHNEAVDMSVRWGERVSAPFEQ